MKRQVTVTIPATTANLGPGYDCLGLALTLYNEVCMVGSEETVTIAEAEATATGQAQTTKSSYTISVAGIDQEKIPTDESNLVARAAELIFRRAGVWPRSVAITLRNAIPVGSGLGSSSAAVLGGMFAANALVGAGLANDDILRLATELEGHPDNVAPAIYGGLVLGILTHNAANELEVTLEKIAIPPLQAVVVLPDFPFSTAEARAILPPYISRAEAIHNASRLPLLIRALETADYSRLREAMQDRLHQPYRLPLIPGSEAAMAAAYAAGAAGVALSGAGPSLIAFARDDHDLQQAIRQAMSSAFAAANLSTRSWLLTADRRGCQVSDIHLV
jgi:homoserine kinase